MVSFLGSGNRSINSRHQVFSEGGKKHLDINCKSTIRNITYMNYGNTLDLQSVHYWIFVDTR
jgi:hypothetical protein